MAKKFVLIDQSVEGAGGHHLEYALRVLDAARDDGFETVLGAGINFDEGDEIDHASHAMFRHSFWENMQRGSPLGELIKTLRDERSRQVERKKASELRKRYNRHYSQPGLDEQRAREVDSLRDELLELFTTDLAAVPSRRSSIAWRRRYLAFNDRMKARTARFDDHIRKLPRPLPGLFFRSRNFFTRQWRRFVRLLRVGVTALIVLFIAPSVLFKAIFKRGQTHRKQFADDLKRFVRVADLKADDIVFIPTLGETELLGISDFCGRSALARDIRWAPLFRRDLFSGRAIGHARQNDFIPVRRFRLSLNELRDRMKTVGVQFYTDTDPLTAQYNMTGIYKFETLPIPVGREFAKNPPDRTRPIVFGYLGDARDEKGFPLLAEAINLLYPKYIIPGRLRLRAQSNFNVEGGEPGSVASAHALSAMASDFITLVDGPFDSDEYAEQFAATHAILVPYDRDGYASRSSGVFAEALVAARPTIVTSGSWMATILEPYRQAYIRTLSSANLTKSPASGAMPLVAKRLRGDTTLGQIGEIKQLQWVTHLICELEFPIADDKLFLNLRFSYSDSLGNYLSSHGETVQVISETVYVLADVPENASTVTIEIVPLDELASVLPQVVTITPTSLPAETPSGFGGRIVEPTPIGIANAMAEITENYDAYSDMMTVISPDWRDYCDAALIVKTIDEGVHGSSKAPASPDEFADQVVKRYFTLRSKPAKKSAAKVKSKKRLSKSGTDA